MTTPTDVARLRELLEKATRLPWEWQAEGPGEGDISLGGVDDPVGEFHILTPSVCEACRARGAPCLAPSQADAALIVAAVNALPGLLDRLAACEEALRQIALDIEPERVVSSIGYWKAIQTARAALGGSDDR